jgi:hypothetical protein
LLNDIFSLEECLAGRSDDYVAFAKFLNRDPISPLPRLDDMLDSIGEANAKYFSVI